MSDKNYKLVERHLVELGTDRASQRLRALAEISPDVDTLAKNLCLVQIESISILAHMVYNATIEGGGDAEIWIGRFAEGIRKEYKFLVRSNQMEAVGKDADKK